MLLKPIVFVLLSQLNPLDEGQNLLLIHKAEEQIQKLEKILRSSRQQEEDLAEVKKILSQLLSDIDDSLEPHRSSSEYQKAILAIQREQLMTDRQKLEEAKNKKMQGIEKRLDHLSTVASQEHRDNVLLANEADLEQIERLEKLVQDSHGQKASALTVHSSLNTWKASVRLSSQLSELLNRLDKISKELEYKRLLEELAIEREKEMIFSAPDSLFLTRSEALE